MSGKKVNSKVKIGGKEYPCRITMGAMLRFRRETGYDVNQLKSDNTSDYIIFIWCCTASACNADGVEFGYSLDDFADRLDPNGLNSLSLGTAEDGGGAQEKKTENPTS